MNLGSRRMGSGCSTCGGGVNHPTNQCDERKVVSISKAGDSLIIALDDCTFFKADMSVLDACVCGGEGTGANPADVAAMKALKDSIAKLQEKVTALEAKEDKDTVFNPESLIGRIAALENKEDKDTVYDDTAIRNLIEALQNKEDKDTVFDPSALEARVAALESKEDKDTVYDDTALAARVKALEDAPAGDKVDTTKFVRKDELVDVQNWSGTVRFKAYPVDVTNEPPVRRDENLDHLL